MNYAVFESGGKQYKVKKGDVVEVERVKNDGKSVVFENVLLQVKDGKVTIGNPYIKGAQIKAAVKEDKRGEKLNILRYRSKSRHRRRVGHRHQTIAVEIQDLEGKGKSTRENKTKS